MKLPALRGAMGSISYLSASISEFEEKRKEREQKSQSVIIFK